MLSTITDFRFISDEGTNGQATLLLGKSALLSLASFGYVTSWWPPLGESPINVNWKHIRVKFIGKGKATVMLADGHCIEFLPRKKPSVVHWKNPTGECAFCAKYYPLPTYRRM